MEAACANPPVGGVLIFNIQPFGLPFGVWREPENPEGAIQDPLVDSAPLCGSQIRIPDAEIHAVLSAALRPEIPIGDLRYERRGGGALGSNQSPPTPPPTRANSSAGILYMMTAEFHPGYQTITCLQDVNRLEHDHWINPIHNLPHVRRHALWWNLWQNVRYPVTNADHTGRCAVVHAVDPADLGLPPQPEGHAILLYAYEGEELCSVLEGNGFCFPVRTREIRFYIFKGMRFFPWSSSI